jgi:hypothetical protein
MTLLADQLYRVGAVQFGQFARDAQFAPLAFEPGLLASFPPLLTSLAEALAPLAQQAGATHLLAMPSAVPLATAVTLITGHALIYPVGKELAGAYDFNEPTVLLTDLLTDGRAETQMAAFAAPLGLDVKFIVCAFTLKPVERVGALPVLCWRSAEQLVAELTGLTPTMRDTAQRWLQQL